MWPPPMMAISEVARQSLVHPLLRSKATALMSLFLAQMEDPHHELPFLLWMERPTNRVADAHVAILIQQVATCPTNGARLP